MKIIASAISLITLIGLCFSYFFWMDNRYAQAQYVRAVEQKARILEQRLDYKIISDRVAAIEERIWKIKSREGENPKSVVAKEELMHLNKDLEVAKASLKRIENNILK